MNYFLPTTFRRILRWEKKRARSPIRWGWKSPLPPHNSHGCAPSHLSCTRRSFEKKRNFSLPPIKPSATNGGQLEENDRDGEGEKSREIATFREREASPGIIFQLKFKFLPVQFGGFLLRGGRAVGRWTRVGLVKEKYADEMRILCECYCASQGRLVEMVHWALCCGLINGGYGIGMNKYQRLSCKNSNGRAT